MVPYDTTYADYDILMWKNKVCPSRRTCYQIIHDICVYIVRCKEWHNILAHILNTRTEQMTCGKSSSGSGQQLGVIINAVMAIRLWSYNGIFSDICADSLT